MRARWSQRWGLKISAIVLVGGILSTGWGLGVASASPPPSHSGNPFQAILDKLDQVFGKVGGTVDRCYGGNVVGRFVVKGGEVCDRTTGLTWEQQPNSTRKTYDEAVAYCQNKGNHYRLPAVKELYSLVDHSGTSPGPQLPAGHPFVNVQADDTFSVTTLGSDRAWAVCFCAGFVIYTVEKIGPNYVWCVRGA